MTAVLPAHIKGADDPLIPVLAVVGVGLIGGSFAAALRRTNQVRRVLGVERNARSLAQALGLIDASVSLKEAAQQADLILIATPVGGLETVLSQMRPYLRDATVLTDVGSTKAEVVQTARRVLGKQSAQFVPGHPIAGAERSGPEAAIATLFKHRDVVLTPLAENPPQAIALVRSAWQACGARVLDMTASAHDQVLASISHVPHFLSSVYMAQVAQAADATTRLALAGSGFRDFTRIAAGSAKMWRDIFLSNREAVQTELTAIRKVLMQAEAALQAQDGFSLQALLEQAAQARRNWPKE
jgi:prephenate dehydrogenase